MDKQEFEFKKKLIELEFKAKKEFAKLSHENNMKEIKEEGKQKLAVENQKFENIMSNYRIRRADGNLRY